MPDSITFDWDSGQSPEALADDLEALEDALGRHLEAAMQKAALKIEADAKRLAAVESGRLRSSIGSGVRHEGSTLVASIGTNLEYAVWVERGRGPIEAAPGEVLHFTIDGEEIFTKRVGPAEAQPFLSPAVEDNLDTVEEYISDGVDAAVAEVS